MIDVTVREACAASVPELARMEAALFSDAWSEKSLASTLQSSCSFSLIATCDGAAVGYLLASLLAPEGELLRIGVHPAYRKKGIGACLMEHFLTAAKAKGCDTLFLEVRSDNLPAISLYRRFGFLDYGVRKKYYHDPQADALLMRLSNDKNG